MRTVVIAQPTRRKRPEPSPAWRLYDGSQQRLVQEGLSLLWDRYGHRALIDEVLLSPWHGPLEPDRVVAPYDFSWKRRPRAEVERMVRETRVVERLQEAVAGFDLVLVLLSKTYLAPLRLAQWVPATAPQRWLFFASGEGLPYLPVAANARRVPAGTPEARAARVKVLDLKSYLFRALCRRVAAEGEAALEGAWEAAQDLS
ncbi:MAG: hypothetical protein ACOY94_10770 [Bacillota bacterium]